jgi:hypothetical protein
MLKSAVTMTSKPLFHHWLVRAKHNRCLPDCDKLWQHTGAGELIGELTFAMAARHGVKARTVRQQLWV